MRVKDISFIVNKSASSVGLQDNWAEAERDARITVTKLVNSNPKTSYQIRMIIEVVEIPEKIPA